MKRTKDQIKLITENAYDLSKIRNARSGRDPLRGVVEVDEAFWRTEQEGIDGRFQEAKCLIIVAAEEDVNGIGRIRLRPIADATRQSLHEFIHDVIEPGSTVRTDGLRAYAQLEGYVRFKTAFHPQRTQPEESPPPSF